MESYICVTILCMKTNMHGVGKYDANSEGIVSYA